MLNFKLEYQQMSLHFIMRLLSPHVWILSAAVTDVGPKKEEVAVFLWRNSSSGPKKNIPLYPTPVVPGRSRAA